jgi:hypothetical protein
MTKRYKVGDKFRLSPDALENYGPDHQGKVYTVRSVYDHHVKASEMANDPTGHPGFDKNGGSPLYGSELNFDLYAWEMERAQ